MPVAPKTRKRDIRRFSAHQRGYGKAWRNPNKTGFADIEFNRVITESGDPWCRICRREPAVLMDHVVAPSTKGEPGSVEYERWFRDPNNLEPCCLTCNNIKGDLPMSHPTVQALMPPENRIGFDANGTPYHGSPYSGSRHIGSAQYPAAPYGPGGGRSATSRQRETARTRCNESDKIVHRGLSLHGVFDG